MLNLYEFLEMCDPNMKVAITNENGVGGASYVAWPYEEWTVKQAIDELGCGGYHVCNVSIHGDMLYIEADENPWDFGSYWDGSWYGATKSEGYEVELKATMFTVEPTEEDAKATAMDMLTSGDCDMSELRIVKKHPVEYVEEHWAW